MRLEEEGPDEQDQVEYHHPGTGWGGGVVEEIDHLLKGVHRGEQQHQAVEQAGLQPFPVGEEHQLDGQGQAHQYGKDAPDHACSSFFALRKKYVGLSRIQLMKLIVHDADIMAPMP